MIRPPRPGQSVFASSELVDLRARHHRKLDELATPIRRYGLMARIAMVTLRDHLGRLTGEVKHHRWGLGRPRLPASARPGRCPMATRSTSTAVAAIEPVFTEPERLALAGFLAGYTGIPTRQPPQIVGRAKSGQGPSHSPLGNWRRPAPFPAACLIVRWRWPSPGSASTTRSAPVISSVCRRTPVLRQLQCPAAGGSPPR
jgi:hypothetical protein